MMSSTASTVAQPGPPPRLHQPWRGWVALAEVVVAAAAVWFGVWCWGEGIAKIVTSVPGQAPLVSSVFYGNWMAGAVGLVLLAGLLVLDALRQTLLAVRARPKKHREPAEDLPELAEDPPEPAL